MWNRAPPSVVRGGVAVSTVIGTSRSSFKVYVSAVGLAFPMVWNHDSSLHAPDVDDDWSAAANVNSVSEEEFVLESVAVDDVIGE